MRSGAVRVADLAADHPISRPAISKHLRLLVEAGLVTAEVHGRERHYALTAEGLGPVAHLLAELSGPDVARRLDPATLDALETEVRRTTRDRRTGVRETTDHEHEETA
jgi:DNA-binding transcriptional ArsR family regulator